MYRIINRKCTIIRKIQKYRKIYTRENNKYINKNHEENTTIVYLFAHKIHGENK